MGQKAIPVGTDNDDETLYEISCGVDGHPSFISNDDYCKRQGGVRAVCPCCTGELISITCGQGHPPFFGDLLEVGEKKGVDKRRPYCLGEPVPDDWLDRHRSGRRVVTSHQPTFPAS